MILYNNFFPGYKSSAVQISQRFLLYFFLGKEEISWILPLNDLPYFHFL